MGRTSDVTILEIRKENSDPQWIRSILPQKVPVRPAVGPEQDGRFQVIDVQDLQKARTRLEKGGVDVVLLDSRGWDEDLGVLGGIKATAPNVPIIVLSDVFRPEDLFHLMGNGIQEYLVKEQVTGDRFCRVVLSAIERQRFQGRVERSGKREWRDLDVLMEMSLGGVAVFQDGVLRTANPVFDHIMGYELGESRGKPLSAFCMMENRDGLRTLIDLEAGPPPVVTARRKDGAQLHLEVQTKPLCLGAETVFVMTIHDITESWKAEENLRHHAYWDSLTDLPNRYLFFENLAGALNEACRTGEKVALFFLDLDRFKIINDTLGHAVGDRLLKIVAKRLSNAVGPGNKVARLGGDEFTIIFQGVQGLEVLQGIARRIHRVLEEAIQIDRHELHVTVSIGISIYPDDTQVLEKLIQQADVAMYKAKENGRNDFSFYQGAMDKGGLEKLDLTNSLYHAFDHEEFDLVYQPQMDLRTGRVVGLEALLRWTHPTLGPISPVEFIPLTEENGLIIPLGIWVLKKACAQNKAWQVLGLPPVRVAVNISAVQFFKHTLPFLIDRILKETGLDPRYLELEITEGAAMRDPVYSLAALREMVEVFKLRVTLDDFGVAFSSLGYLKLFPMHCLKIDKSFIDGIGQGAKDDAIVSSIILLAKEMGLEVVAEGVEREDQLEFLRMRHCSAYQGYLLAKPMTVPQTEKLLREQIKSLPAARGL